MENIFKINDRVILNEMAIEKGINIYSSRGKLNYEDVYFIIDKIENSNCHVSVYGKIFNNHLSHQVYYCIYLKYLKDFDKNLIESIIINLNKLENEF